MELLKSILLFNEIQNYIYNMTGCYILCSESMVDTEEPDTIRVNENFNIELIHKLTKAGVKTEEYAMSDILFDFTELVSPILRKHNFKFMKFRFNSHRFNLNLCYSKNKPPYQTCSEYVLNGGSPNLYTFTYKL